MAMTRLFADPATARDYIKSLAMSIEDPVDMSTFLALCDIAQAALAYCVIAETHYGRCNQTHTQNIAETKDEISAEIMKSLDACIKATAEIEQIKDHLKTIISKLDIKSIP